MPIELDPIFLAFLGILLLFVLATYLYVRKILIGFREGIEEGRR